MSFGPSVRRNNKAARLTNLFEILHTIVYHEPSNQNDFGFKVGSKLLI